jgi:phage terminase large subunit-like protein
MKIYRKNPDGDYLLWDLVEDKKVGHVEAIKITEKKLRKYLWVEQPFIGGPDDLVRIFIDVLSKIYNE